ncbi:MAG: LacI family transcriptional regulator [Lentisphaerae bacterium]|nr:LacI family transcriptional regulator [Lentisphaerota bacterium]
MRKKRGCSIADIAAALNISTSTVSRALRAVPSISGVTVRKVLAEAQKQGYIPAGRKKNLVIVLPFGTLSIYESCMLDSLCQECEANGIGWEIINPGNLPVIPERLIHGIVSLDYRDLHSSFLTNHFNLPLVAVNEFPNISEKVYSISSDAGDGIRQAMCHLKMLGHSKITYLYSINSKNYCSAKRLEAFDAIGSEMNLVCRSFPIMINPMYGDELLEIVRGQMEHGFTAVIAEGERVGIYAGSCLRHGGIEIPGDISLITWEIPGISEHLFPSMTTIGQDFTALARAVINGMISLWNGETLPFLIKIPYLFFDRDSTTVSS